MLSSPCLAWLCLFVFLLFSTSHVEATPTHKPANFSASNPSICVTSPEWSTPNLTPKDCIAAAMRFNVRDLAQHEGQSFEFVPYGRKPRSGLAIQRTPKRYTYNSCTMAVVNLAAFSPEDIPGMRPEKLFPLTDIGKYEDIWGAVRKIMDNCLDKFCDNTCGSSSNFVTQTGWSYTGYSSAIGVFFWGSGSTIDDATMASTKASFGQILELAAANDSKVKDVATTA